MTALIVILNICRYYHICEKAIDKDMVAPLQTHWIESVSSHVSVGLRENFPEATKDFIQVTYINGHK